VGDGPAFRALEAVVSAAGGSGAGGKGGGFARFRILQAVKIRKHRSRYDGNNSTQVVVCAHHYGVQRFLAATGGLVESRVSAGSASITSGPFARNVKGFSDAARSRWRECRARSTFSFTSAAQCSGAELRGAFS